MTRRSRRASSAPRRVGSDEGLTSTRPSTETSGADSVDEDSGQDAAGASAAQVPDAEDDSTGAAPAQPAPVVVEQTSDDTDEGWGERGDDDASARWLRENRPPHWS